MPNLKNSKTHENLKAAFAGESQANRRYLYFAKQADVEGRPDIGPDEADHVDIEGEKLSRPDYEEGSPDIKP